ncbi:hypothetical protein BAE44_0005135 [Dichanthelium oligosanthes]|uniref:Uncharacterized protein n=1 Tax=Dichanthelium oligosanthes TaxID=888268 RepID=A0A1E5W8V3_9POAL|nr:hypothetical protein BAE44_0005135 [Dichanthelium oligosanthes]
MGRAAVDRSAGTCESFRGITDANFLAYLAPRYDCLSMPVLIQST